MNQAYPPNPTSTWIPQTLHQIESQKTRSHLLRAFTSGLLLPLGFAPFHLPGLAILSLALLFLQITNCSPKHAFMIGFTFAVGLFGLGTSWVYNSIHTYGHLNLILSSLITLIFIAFLSFYIGLFSLVYAKINHKLPTFISPFLFSSLWLFTEYFRSTVFTGFPWLLLGFGQIDSPLKHLLPIIGVLGVSWVTALASGFLALAINKNNPKKILWLVLFITLLITPSALNHKTWTTTHHEPISVGVIQADLSMRDKWNSGLYQKIKTHYQETSTDLMSHTNLIVMPESAIPLPTSYAGDILNTLDAKADTSQSGILLGIPHPSLTQPEHYHNALVGLGHARGIYAKQHLVPFGEYIPNALKTFTQWLNLPNPSLTHGDAHQTPITFNQYTLASLICYEVAYPTLLRAQLPKAAFIVSISDDGWFGHSFAIYQQLQMAQALSKQTERFQIVSNNLFQNVIILIITKIDK